MSELGAAPFLVLLAAAVTSSLLIAVLYQHFFASAATGSQIYRSFGLFGLSITAKRNFSSSQWLMIFCAISLPTAGA